MSGTLLNAGDIAFTAFQADNAGGSFNGDAVEFVLLRPIVAGTIIFLTDSGFRTDTLTLRTNENVLRYVAQTDIAAGTLIAFVDSAGNGETNTATFTGITQTTGAVALNAAFGLAGGGDNPIAFQTPTFGGAELLTGTYLAALTFGGATFATTHTNLSGNATTALPTGLTDGDNALSLASTDNGRFNGGNQTGTNAAIRTTINTDANWQTSTTAFATGSSNATYTVTGYTFTGTTANNSITATTLNDTIDGGAGIDTLSFLNIGTGLNVTVSLALQGSAQTTGAGSDTFSNFENLQGGAGNDALTGDGVANVINGGAGNDTIDGGLGFDIASYVGATAGVTVNLVTGATSGAAGIDTLSNVEGIIGSAVVDSLTGDAGTNSFDGRGGGDTLAGGTGWDDYILNTGETINEIAEGDANTVYVNFATTYTLGTGIGSSAAVAGLAFNLTGKALNNSLTGSELANTIDGGDGNDSIGGGGTDNIFGGLGADSLTGGIDDDTYYVNNACGVIGKIGAEASTS